MTRSAGLEEQRYFLIWILSSCLISADLALHYPKKLAGVVGISGYFHFFPRWKSNINTKAKKTPWLFTHGYRDDVLSIEDTRFGVNKLKEAGLDVKWIELNKRHTLEDEEYPIIRRWVQEQLFTNRNRSNTKLNF